MILTNNQPIIIHLPAAGSPYEKRDLYSSKTDGWLFYRYKKPNGCSRDWIWIPRRKGYPNPKEDFFYKIVYCSTFGLKVQEIQYSTVKKYMKNQNDLMDRFHWEKKLVKYV